MGSVKSNGAAWLRPVACLLVAVACALAAYALYTQQQTQTRGLNLGAPLNRPLNLYGLNIHLLGTPDAAQQLANLRKQGFGWVRQSFDWQATDPAQADALISAAHQNGLGFVAVLTGATPPDPVAFAQWAGEFASRNRDKLDYYQIWDEPNLASGWNGAPNPAAYAALLQTAYAAIHSNDPSATVLLAGLAPTTETGPKNLSDVLFLNQLYDLGAQPYFDAVAGKPYGFNTGPADRTTDANTLNFSRLILLREVMVANNDATKFVWGSNFGWNTRPSIWGQVTTDQQTSFTLAAYTRATDEWPWAGPLFLETPAPTEQADDPHGGFALATPLAPLSPNGLIPGQFAAQFANAYTIYDGAWKFSDLGADIPQTEPSTVSIHFVGTSLAVTVRRADYRAYLYVTVDGKPANALPIDSDGKAYLILTSPDLQPQTNTLTLASGLAPGPHVAFIRADRGWDQWALVSYTVSPNVGTLPLQWPLSALGLIALLSLIGLVFTFPSTLPTQPSTFFSRLGTLGQTILTALVAAALWASAWLTWGSDAASAFRRYGDTAPLIITVITAGLLYYSPFLILTLLSSFVLFVLFYLRPELALGLIAFFAPFYLIPRPLFDRAFSMVEICVVLAAVAIALRYLPTFLLWLKGLSQSHTNTQRFNTWLRTPLAWLDLAVFSFLIVCGLSVVTAELRGVALREFRVIVLEPVLFYLLLRVVLSQQPDSATAAQSIWRILDFLILGGVIVSLIGLSDFVTGQNLITAEGGVPRIHSVFGSPNNVGLFLGRILPITAAVALLGRDRRRRILYLIAALPMLAATLLSFSRGALVFGLPAAFAVILLFWGGKRAAVALVGLAVVGLAALGLLSNNPRFANLFSIQNGTGFFRVNVWRSAWAMFLDHPILGVGLDNFLYAYRGFYIQPDAWQEPNLPHAHNIFLDALTRTGFLGLLALLALLASVIALTRQTLKHLSDPNLRALTIGLVASMVDFAAHGLIDTGYWFVDLAFIFMLTLGLLATLSQLASSTNHTAETSGPSSES